MIVRLRKYLLLCLIISFSSAAMAISLKDFKDLVTGIKSTRTKVTTEEEVSMGGNLISGLLGAAALVDDPDLQHYVNDVGFWVALQSERKNLPWQFGVIDSPGINAFAAPGGYIVMTLGLFNLLENEAQLAGVLAHEITHVIKKHHLNALLKTSKRNFWTKLGTRVLVDDDDDREAVNVMVNAGVQLYSTGLDRKFEYDADLKGVVLAARAGYDPYALLDVMTTIDSINPDEASLTVLLKTHPPTAERLDRLTGAMDGNLDQYADGQVNSARFLQVANAINPTIPN